MDQLPAQRRMCGDDGVARTDSFVHVTAHLIPNLEADDAVELRALNAKDRHSWAQDRRAVIPDTLEVLRDGMVHHVPSTIGDDLNGSGAGPSAAVLATE